MRNPRILRISKFILVASWLGATTGCVHYHYHGNAAPAYMAPTDANGVQVGPVCEVPARVEGGTIITQQAGEGAAIIQAIPPPSSNVIVSRPAGGPFSQGLRRGWRSDPEPGLATTRVEGALDDETTRR